MSPGLTLSKSLRVLRDNPMASLDIHHLEPREELAHDGQHLVWDVLAPCAAHEQRGLLEPGLAWVLVREVAHVWERLAEDVDRDAEFLGLGAFRGVQVAEEELTDWEGLSTWLVFSDSHCSAVFC